MLSIGVTAQWLTGLAVAQQDVLNRANPAALVEVENLVDLGELRPTLTWTPVRSFHQLPTNAPSQSIKLLNPAAPLGLEYEDRVRTGTNSRAVISFPGGGNARIGPLTQVVLKKTRTPAKSLALGLLEGLFYFLHHPDADELELTTDSCNAYFRGTEILARVTTNGAEFLVLDGSLTLTNLAGTTNLISGQAAAVANQFTPPQAVVLQATNLIQWILYYPAVIVPDDLHLTEQGSIALNQVLQAYREGSVLEALRRWPAQFQPRNREESLFRAGLALAGGGTAEATALTSGVEDSSLANALRLLLAAVQGRKIEPVPHCDTASTWLALSYYRQASGDLTDALAAVEAAASISTNGYVLARLAELEFSFGHSRRAIHSVDQALKSTPKLATARAMRGYLSLAERRPEDAIVWFNQAIEADSALGIAWLGRGLADIQLHQPESGRLDLLNAATIEPQHWIFRDYLAKADSHVADQQHNSPRRRRLLELARHQLELAKQKDPAEPTAWLYSALEYDRENRLAAAIEDLEQSILLNTNRALFRSHFLLDQDAAVRSANLADIFARAGMQDLSLREAAKAVAHDPLDPSGHLYLAGSFNALRDPTRFNLRYETEWFNEHLLASLLSPVDFGKLSQNLSPNEYSRLFPSERLHFDSTTEYFGRGEWREVASQSGTFDRLSYALDLDSDFRPGEFNARDLSRIEWYSRIKCAVTAEDTLLLLTKYMDYQTGDFFARFDPRRTSSSYQLTENEDPIVLAGWRHEWSPEHQTLLLGGHLEDRQVVTVNDISSFLRDQDSLVHTLTTDLGYTNTFGSALIEAQHLMRNGAHSDIFGARFEQGDIRASEFIVNQTFPGYYGTNFLSTIAEPWNHFSLYEYHTWEWEDHLLLTGGLSFDDSTAPSNYRRPPVTAGENHRSAWSPKVALIWMPSPIVSARGMWARALGGVSLDESVRLEPTQLAGFGQAFRSLVNESLVGSVELPAYEVAGAALDFKFNNRTFLGLMAQRLSTDIERTSGVLENTDSDPATTQVRPMSESLNYVESRASATLNVILANRWFGEFQYRFIHSQLNHAIPGLLDFDNHPFSTHEWADLHEVRPALLYHHEAGFFARAEVNWFHQQGARAADDPLTQAAQWAGTEPHQDESWQINLFAGWQFRRRRAEVTLGVLNLANSDYRFAPLSPLEELPRARMFYSRVRLNF